MVEPSLIFDLQTLLIAECLEDLQLMVDRLVGVSNEENGLSLNIKVDTQLMVITSHNSTKKFYVYVKNQSRRIKNINSWEASLMKLTDTQKSS